MGFVMQSCREPEQTVSLDFDLQGWERDDRVGVLSRRWGRNQSQKEVAGWEGMCSLGAWPSGGRGGCVEIRKVGKKPRRRWLSDPGGRVSRLAAGMVSGREGPRPE